MDSKHLYNNTSKFSTWFYTIAVNLVKNNNRRKQSIGFVSLNKIIDDDPENSNLESDTLTPEDFANSHNELHTIQTAIDSLNDSFKEVIILRYIWEYDYEEISRVTGVPLGTVKSRISRSLKLLAKKLKLLNKSY